jgi:hypothetical protein
VKLTELEPRFLRYEKREDGVFWPHAVGIHDAQGISFLCPLCFEKNGGPVNTHSVICWSRSRGVPDDASPGPGRWMLDGTGFADLTLNGDPPGNARSVLLTGGCNWHGYITNGEATHA